MRLWGTPAGRLGVVITEYKGGVLFAPRRPRWWKRLWRKLTWPVTRWRFNRHFVDLGYVDDDSSTN